MDVSKDFLRDLRTVHDSYGPGGPPPGEASSVRMDDLLHLERLLKDYREKTNARVESRLASLPKDHVLFAEIGLFGPLGLQRRETAYTNTLAWLLNPAPRSGGNHGFGASVLHELLRYLTGTTEELAFTVDAVEAEHPLMGAASDRPGRADVWIQGRWSSPHPRPGGRFIVVIEAKVDAAEGDDQLSRYEVALQAHRDRGDEVYFVYLTPDGRDERTAGRHDWRNMSFNDLAKILTRQLDPLRDRAGHPILRLYIVSLLRSVWGAAASRKNLYVLDEYLSDFEAKES